LACYGEHNKIYLCWTKGQQNNEENIIADLLAKKRVRDKLIGPEPRCCLSQQTASMTYTWGIPECLWEANPEKEQPRRA